MKKTTLGIAACAVAFCGSEMGRRSRQRLKTKVAVPPTRRDRMARVNVADDVWADFRSLAGDRPIAAILGELVTRKSPAIVPDGFAKGSSMIVNSSTPLNAPAPPKRNSRRSWTVWSAAWISADAEAGA